MKAFSRLMVAACLLCAAPLALACEGKCEGKCYGARGGTFLKEMDTNNDGVITKKEFDAFHDARFKELDANHDGKITKDEIDAVHQKMMEHGKERMEHRFDETDVNHDGFLSKDEAEIGMPMVFAHFDDVDTNKDGKLSKEEFDAYLKKMHEQMRGRHGAGMMPGRE